MPAWSVRQIDPTRVRDTLGGREPEVWLHGAAGGWSARLSLLAAGPVAVIEQFEDRPATLTIAGRTIASHADGWTLWRQVHRRVRRDRRSPWPLGPGWVGYVGFEMARRLERLPASVHEPLGLPLMRMALYDAVVVIDHATQQAWRVEAPLAREKLAALSGTRHEGTEARRHKVVAQSEQATGNREQVSRVAGVGERGTGCTARGISLSALRSSPLALRPDFSQPDYERIVARALEYIRAGDIYQVNLAQRFVIEPVPDAAEIFERLQEVNPAPYAALIRWDDRAVISASPELLLECRRGRLRTCPIKGTRPRTGDPRLDRAAIDELLSSEKETAELTMIVDLHRNDLGRVCRVGSVRVASARRLEAHPTVYHTVAEVTGELRAGCDAIDALAACFPAGSVTGVPKIRAMQIIDELEPVARGAYCGAIGHLGLDGDATFNVAIRTLQLAGTRATLYVGGGIVAESDPVAEYAETLAKARGILAALGIDTPAAVVAAASAPRTTVGTAKSEERSSKSET